MADYSYTNPTLLLHHSFLLNFLDFCSEPIEASSDLGVYILRGVTQAMTYEQLNARIRVSCSRDVYYETYRRFFWLLDKARK